MLIFAVLLACSDYKVTQLEPRLSVTPAVIDFGPVPAGETVAARVGVVNSGAAPLILTAPAVEIDGPAALTATLDALEIAPGGAANLDLAFTPAGEEEDAGVVTLRDEGELSAEIVWTGSGVIGALAVAPAALDFGSLLAGETDEQVLALTNTGLAAVTVDALSLEGDDGYAVAPLGAALPLRVEAGATSVLTVDYTAADTLPALANLHIHSDDPHGDTLTVPLSANTEAPNNRPVISLLSPADGDTLSEGQAYTLRAFALDVETPSPELLVRFDSLLLGTLGEVHPDASGEVLLETVATTLGDDVITATVTDADGATNEDHAAITITDCQELSWDRTEAFDSTFDDSLFAINGAAYVDAATEELVLTDLLTWQAGAIYLQAPILLERFHVALRFRIDPGSGADGLAVVAATGADPDAMLGKTGEQLGVGNIAGVSGFVVEVDVHPNGTRGDPAGDHIALVSLPDYAHIGDPIEVGELEDSVPHELVVDFTEGLVEVTLDGAPVLSTLVPDWVVFEGYLGATAATGALTNRHVLERWDVRTGCW